MRKTIEALLCTSLLAILGAVHAETAFTEGEVRKVDRENRKITLKHGEIRNIDMPPMTMDFVLKDAKLLEKLQPGDKVRFRAVNEGGKFTVTELHALK